MGVGGGRHDTAALPPGKGLGMHCKGDWVGHRASLDRCGKTLPPPGFNPQTVQPIAS